MSVRGCLAEAVAACAWLSREAESLLTAVNTAVVAVEDWVVWVRHDTDQVPGSGQVDIGTSEAARGRGCAVGSVVLDTQLGAVSLLTERMWEQVEATPHLTLMVVGEDRTRDGALFESTPLSTCMLSPMLRSRDRDLDMPWCPAVLKPGVDPHSKEGQSACLLLYCRIPEDVGGVMDERGLWAMWWPAALVTASEGRGAEGKPLPHPWPDWMADGAGPQGL